MLAGGTDLYPAHVGRQVALAAARHHRASPRCAASGATTRGWTIGATTTWSDVVRAELPPLFDALKAAAREVGGVQIQNTGTVAGNLCNASPAADGTPVLMALGATRRAAQRARRARRCRSSSSCSATGARRAPPTSCVVAVRVPARGARARSAFAKLGGRRYLTISITTVAVVVDVDASGAVAYAGVAVGSCSAVARRLPALEARLVGAPRPTATSPRCSTPPTSRR